MQQNATQCPSWDEFVNVWRQKYGSNDELDAPYIRNMREDDLRRAIGNITAKVQQFDLTNK